MSAPAVLVLAIQGSGKTTSVCPNEAVGIKGLNPAETGFINVTKKPLPMKGWRSAYTPLTAKEFGNYYEGKDYNSIAAVVNAWSKSKLKNIVIDDVTYLMSLEQIEKASEKGYEKFTKGAQNFYNLIALCQTLPDDKVVYFLGHCEATDDPKEPYRMQTSGKMLQEKLNIQGLFSMVLFCSKEIEDGKASHFFVTNYDGTFNAKTPVGMFDALHIPNDLGVVNDAIRAYYM